MSKGRIITALAAMLAIPAMAAPAGYFQVPGTETTLKIYGFAETWGYYTMNAGDIETHESKNEKNTVSSVVYGRVGVTSTTPSPYGDVNVKVEFDARSQNDTASWGGVDFDNDEVTGTTFRLRHAYGEFGGLLIGQTSSLFLAWHYVPAYNDNWNGDFNGTGATYRTRQIRYTFSPADAFKLGVSMEHNVEGSSKPASNVVAAAQYSADKFAVTASVGYLKKRDWEKVGTDENTTSGSGVSFAVSGSFNITDNDTIGAKYVNGGGKYGNAFPDGFRDDETEAGTQHDFIKSNLIDLGYTHNWGNGFDTNAGIAYTWIKKDTDHNIDNKLTRTDFFINTNWAVTKNVTFGVEYFDSVVNAKGDNNKIFAKDSGTSSKTHFNGFNVMFHYNFF